MSYALQVNPDTHRIKHATYPKHVNPGNADKYILVYYLPGGEIPQEQDITNYLYIGGEYIYDPKPESEPVTPAPTVWDELDAAYQEGYDEGYQEGVDTAYDE